MRVAIDTETFRITNRRLAPKLVCASFATHPPGSEIRHELLRADDGLRAFRELLAAGDELVFHNAAFDLAVFVAFDESGDGSLLRMIFDALEDGRIHDTGLRERLLNIAEWGCTQMRFFSDGGALQIRGYSLAQLAKNYGVSDRLSEKVASSDDEDAVRVNFDALDGLSVEEYPETFVRYAIDDVEDTLRVFEAQEMRRAEGFPTADEDPFATMPLHVSMDFALHLASCHGVRVDSSRRGAVEAAIRERIRPDVLRELYASGVIRPARQGAVGRGGRPLKDLPESRDMSVLRALVQKAYEDRGETPPMTEGGEKRGPSISTSDATIAAVEPFSEVLRQYRIREAEQKMLTTDLPRMSPPEDDPFVHPQFEVLKKTGRTSSRGGSELFCSMNIQNPHPDARQLVVPSSSDRALFSVDFSSIELVTLAQQCLRVVGRSRLAELLREGVDPHSWLGSALAYEFSPEFRDSIDRRGIADREGVFRTFMALKSGHCQTHEKPVTGCVICETAARGRALFKHYRTFAKPTGLGFPGGLGPDTFIQYAYATFSVVISDRSQAVRMRDIWHSEYPEMLPYFAYVKAMQDRRFPDHLAYRTPLGMIRSRCSFTEAANGFGLQSPAAEGGKIAFHVVTREAYDESLRSRLFGGIWPLAFIHDEIFGEVLIDERTHERISRVQEIMVGSMKQICPDVPVRTEAVLMDRWSKSAEAVKGPDGRLGIWRHP